MITELLGAGVAALKDYIALHVLTCLIPAFLLAGAMVSFISKEAIVRYIGAAASKVKSFPLAAGGSFFVAACSCTVIPVSSGLYYGGAGVGPAFILLWVAPAANVLALVYTGAILGGRMVITRLVVALLVAFVIGWVMSLAFLKDERRRVHAMGSVAASGASDAEPGAPVTAPRLVAAADLTLLVLLVAALLAPNYLVQRGPYLHKVYVWAVGMAAVFGFALWAKSQAEVARWLRESWWFVRLIFPLLLVGVFAVGVIGELLPEVWIQRWLGSSNLLSAFLATLIGGVSYFATMTESPFVDKLMELGMAPGAALALLLTGPGISLPNWLAVARMFGPKKAALYVVTVIFLGTLFGWAAGVLVF